MIRYWGDRFQFTMNILLLALIVCCCNSLSAASDARFFSGSTIPIFVGAGDQGRLGFNGVFDPVHNRFLAVWSNEPDVNVADGNIVGQLVNSDGTLSGGRIAFSQDSYGVDIKSVFDSSNQRYMVVWFEGESTTFKNAVFGQIVNSDGALPGGRITIACSEYYNSVSPEIAFDGYNQKYMVVWVGDLTTPWNIYGQALNSDGTPYGSVIQITNYPDYYAAAPKIAFDSVGRRFLVVWGNQYDGCMYGRFVSSDGTLSANEIDIGSYGLGASYVPSLAYSPVHQKFLHVWGTRGAQLINADGSLDGNAISIFQDAIYAIYSVSAAFDNRIEQFVIYAGVGYPFQGIGAESIDSEGNVSNTISKVWERTLGLAVAVSGSADTGTLVLWRDSLDYFATYPDIYGTL